MEDTDKNDRLVKMLRTASHNLYLAALSGRTEKTQSLFEELKRPKVGDLVMETTTYYMKDRNPKEGIGTLVFAGYAPLYATREEATAAGYEEDDDMPEQFVYDITLDFDDGRLFRWTNADFIKIKQDSF